MKLSDETRDTLTMLLILLIMVGFMYLVVTTQNIKR